MTKNSDGYDTTAFPVVNFCSFKTDTKTRIIFVSCYCRLRTETGIFFNWILTIVNNGVFFAMQIYNKLISLWMPINEYTEWFAKIKKNLKFLF